ncbi:MAG TPA: PD-(D/E)XK nuclease family protein [Oscillatoriaceae cyanobacterium]
MVDKTPFRLSLPALTAYVACAQRFALEHIEKVPEHERALDPVLGIDSAIRLAILRFFRHGGLAARSLADLLDGLGRHWPARSMFADDDGCHDAFQHAQGLLESFYRHPYPEGVAHEVDFDRFAAWPEAKGGVLLSGYLDRTVLLQDGTIEVLIYKTRDFPRKGTTLEPSIEALGYYSLADAVYGQWATGEVRLTYVNLDGMVAATLEIERGKFDRRWRLLQPTLDGLRRDRRHFERGLMLHEAFPMNRGPRCAGCSMRRHCDRTLEWHRETFLGEGTGDVPEY